MTYRNRVSPTGEIVASPLRCKWTGNRGNLHRGTEIVRSHASDLWIICELEFRGWHSELWRPNRFTWLFFHDEAVAFAAGHRPCALCRRDAYEKYRTAWSEALHEPRPSASELNRRLHGERIVRGTHTRRTSEVPWADLPDGAFVTVDNSPALVVGSELVEWTFDGYGARRRRPRTRSADVLTPPSTVAVLRAGYPVQIDASAR